MSDGCKFSNDWVGPCGKTPVNEDGLCEECAKKKCHSCGAPATESCSHASQFVCGFPICDDCAHNPYYRPLWKDKMHVKREALRAWQEASKL